MRKQTFSLLSLASETPKFEVKTAEPLFKNSEACRQSIKYQVTAGLLERVKRHNPSNPRAIYKISELGLMSLAGEERRYECKGLPIHDNIAEGFLGRDPMFPTHTNAFQSPGNSHFKTMEMINLWSQIRFTGKRKHIKMWDYVEHPEFVGLDGNPDIIYYDGFDPLTHKFKRLVFFELETSVKSDKIVKQKIEALIKNEFYFIVFVSRSMSTLRQISSMMRRFIPHSNFYAKKGTYSSIFFEKACHISRIWFLHWDADSLTETTPILTANLRRADHPDFDNYTMTNLEDGSKFKRDHKQDRWPEGFAEWNLEKLLNFIAPSDKHFYT